MSFIVILVVVSAATAWQIGGAVIAIVAGIVVPIQLYIGTRNKNQLDLKADKTVLTEKFKTVNVEIENIKEDVNDIQNNQNNIFKLLEKIRDEQTKIRSEQSDSAKEIERIVSVNQKELMSMMMDLHKPTKN